jgi:hypothetical protein
MKHLLLAILIALGTIGSAGACGGGGGNSPAPSSAPGY